jgi:hypothetical protein
MILSAHSLGMAVSALVLCAGAGEMNTFANIFSTLAVKTAFNLLN